MTDGSDESESSKTFAGQAEISTKFNGRKGLQERLHLKTNMSGNASHDSVHNRINIIQCVKPIVYIPGNDIQCLLYCCLAYQPLSIVLERTGVENCRSPRVSSGTARPSDRPSATMRSRYSSKTSSFTYRGSTLISRPSPVRQVSAPCRPGWPLLFQPYMVGRVGSRTCSSPPSPPVANQAVKVAELTASKTACTCVTLNFSRGS